VPELTWLRRRGAAAAKPKAASIARGTRKGRNKRELEIKRKNKTLQYGKNAVKTKFK
jgi:hypothetical protein